MARSTLSSTNRLQSLIQEHWLMMVIVILATFLRVWRLDSQAIFFGDAAHDLLTAFEAVGKRELPLLGIASSVPRFKQGPLTIWLEMLFYPFFGYHLLGYSLLFALINIGVLIGLYELLLVQINKKTALIAAGLFAFSPLAIAHARMVYHITPLPLATVLFIWALVRLWLKKPWAHFWAALAFAFMFQFELAVFPLVFAIPYIWWKNKQRLSLKSLSQAVGGITLGLTPQIIYDLTHQFQQLGGFGLWVGYRLGSFAIGDHAPSVNKITTFVSSVTLYGGRIGAVNYYLGLLFLLLTALSIGWLTHKLLTQNVPPLIEITLVCFYLLFLGYFVHGAPSEAYYPPFLVLLPILLSYFFWRLDRTLKVRRLLLIGFMVWAFINVIAVFQANFFVSTSHPFNYGPGVEEQRMIIHLIKSHGAQEFYLRTTADGGTFASYFDNLRFWGKKEQLVETATTPHVYFIESKDSPLTSYPNFMKYSLLSRDVYRPL
ncbi:MAG TPA: glycosyltransferase family 39 protein [Patescibacteria group bacterium]